MTDLPFVVVGTGPVAREMGAVLARVGGRCVGVLSRDEGRAQEVAAYLGADVATTEPRALPSEARMVLVATADEAIIAASRALGAAGVARGRALVHFAGSMPAAAMRLPETAGAEVVSVHPLRHFELGRVQPETFPGTFCAIDGDPAPSAELERRLRAAGGVAFRVRSDAKGLYMASVLVPITLVPALVAEAEDGLVAAGVAPGDARALVAALVRHKAAELVARPAVEALHGPLAHGDVPVMTRAIEATRRLRPTLAEVFRVLGDLTIKRAVARRLLSSARAETMRRALDGD